MKNEQAKKGWLAFIIAEVILLCAAAFFAFAVVGYTTIVGVLLGIAALIAIYRAIAHYAKKNEGRAKKLKTLVTVLFYLGIAWFVIVEIPIVGAAKTDANPEAPYLVVLGAGVNGETPSLSLLNRLEAAHEYLLKYPESTVIVSGGQGQGENITEAECMRRWLSKNGIEPERIIMEPRATSTQENLEFSLKLIEEHGGDPTGKLAIVSSEYHLYRAKYMAQELGATPYGVAGHTSYPVLMINYFIREALAVTALWVM
ncbi:MAG: YdcF family protein [Oscillospiraceae bacterium]